MQIVATIILHGLPCLHYGRFHDDGDVDVDGDGEDDGNDDDGDDAWSRDDQQWRAVWVEGDWGSGPIRLTS